MEIIKNWKYNYLYDGKIKLLYYSRLSRLSRHFFGDEILLARFSSIILVHFLYEIYENYILGNFAQIFDNFLFTSVISRR